MNTPLDPAPARSAAGTLFAVDDDESDRLLFLRMVGEAALPYACRLFSSGDEILDALLAVLRGAPAPSVCFVDVKMSGVNGFDVLRWIRAQRALDCLPVVMLSSVDHPDFLAESLHFGAQCYTTKFPTPSQLAEILGAARRFSVTTGFSATFPVSCNLLNSVELAAKA
jgi:CheY-like chemotaxis protein